MTDKTTANRPVLPKTPAMEQLLSIGYGGLTVKKARTIISEREKDPNSWPYEMLEKAQALLAAYETSSEPISTDPGWKR